MTPTERARRTDALYRDRYTKLELCEMIANRESDMDEMRQVMLDLSQCIICFRWCDLCSMWAGDHCDRAKRMRSLGVKCDDTWGVEIDEWRKGSPHGTVQEDQENQSLFPVKGAQ